MTTNLTKMMTTDNTQQRRSDQLIEQVGEHPHQQEIIELARQQLQDMNTLDVVTENK